MGTLPGGDMWVKFRPFSRFQSSRPPLTDGQGLGLMEFIMSDSVGS